MKNEQLNLYGGDIERFKETGKTRREMEKEARENTFINRIIKFIEEKENDLKKITEKENELDGLEIQELAEEFARSAQDEDIIEIKKILAKILLVKGYKLNSSVVRAEIEEKDSTFIERKAKRDSEKMGELKSSREEKIELRKKRDRFFGPQKGLPTGDLD